MGRKFQYVTLDRILSKLYRDLGLEEISEIDVIEWTGEALNFMDTPSLLEEAVAFVEVSNFCADLPNGLHSIIQVAKNNNPTNKEVINPANVILDCEEEITEEFCNSNPPGLENYPVPLDCKGSPLTDVELAYYRPYFDLQYEYSGWNSSSYYEAHYTPIRLANHSFFSSLVCAEDEQIYNNCQGTDEYTISGDKINTSFKDGSIAIAYYRQRVDCETGYPMIPDDVSFTTAITVYITMKYMARLWYMGREGYSDKMQKAEADWQWYCKQASNKAFTLYGIDEHQNFLEGKTQMIPNHNRYYGFFGKLGRPESTKWKDSGNRSFNLNRGI